MIEVHWERFPHVSRTPHARAWLTIQVNLQRAPNTIAAYARALEEYLVFSEEHHIVPDHAGRDHIAAYVRELAERPNPRAGDHRVPQESLGLANATMRLKLTAIRLYYDYLLEEAIRSDNPVGRGHYTPGTEFGGERQRGLIPRYETLPWIPTDDEYRAILDAAREEPLRNQLMLMLAYTCALRREELCALTLADVGIDPRLVRVRAEVTKGRRERVVPYPDVVDPFYAGYLRHRRILSREGGPLFLSESRRNHAQALSIWSWSKIVARLADRASLPQFSTHTLRHLRLTDLARSGWDLHDIALFAGHRRTETTLRYVHRSGRELADKLAASMAAIHAWHSAMIAEVLQ